MTTRAARFPSPFALERELELSRRRLAEAEALARIGSWEWDIANDRVVWSDQLYRIYGLEPGEVEPTYQRFLERVHPDDREAVDARNRKAFADHQPFDDVKRILRPDGSEFLMRTQGEVIEDDQGAAIRMIGVCEDVTDRIRAEQAQAHVAALVSSSQDAIVGYDLEGRIESWNPAAATLYGWTEQEAIGRTIELLVPEELSGEHDAMHRLVAEGSAVDHFETRRRRRDGQLVDVSVTMSPIRTPSGPITGVSTIARDVTERKRFEARLFHLAHHDALTGLFNRTRFEEEVEAALARAARYGRTGAVLVFDLDHVKYVNDTLGHGAGDDLIRAVAAAAQARLRESDVLARIGGDEFAVLVPEASSADARAVAEELLHVIRHHEAMLGGQRVRITASIGVRLFTRETASADVLLADADRAMYEAKDSGRDCVVVHTPERGRQARRESQLGWDRRIRRALDEGGFALHCQPIVDAHSRLPTQYELLLRMREGDKLIPPQAFLGAAERLGLVHRIDRWVVSQAVGLLASANAAGRPLLLEVNLSGRSIGDGELLEAIERETREAGVTPGQLVFEITETAAVANMQEARRFAESLTRLGFRFALDDFGAGFASFVYLKHLPTEYLKIDGDFVRAPRSRADELVVQAIVGVARGLGKRTIAEFVEDEETLTAVRGQGVDLLQGFHTGPPVPACELVQRLAVRSA